MADNMLVIDDEALVLDSCRRIFSTEGYNVVTTNSPKEGLTLINDSAFDVILVDWNMPEFDGMDVITEIEKRSPESAVVMISGYPSVDRATEAMKRGALDFVSKPFSPEEITEAVKKAQRMKLEQEKKELGKVKNYLGSINFPVADIDDKGPSTIAETVSRKVGVGKTTSPWLSVLVLGILAGAYIGFGGVLASTVTFDMAAHMGIGFTKFMAGAVFSLGLMLVIIAGAELFTGNNLMISSVMAGEITFAKMLKRWGLVYITNFIGALLIAFLFFLSGLWKTGGGALGAAAVSTAYGKVSLGFGEALVRAVGCNWLVCLAVWMALSARQTIGKIFAIFFPIMAFVAIGFEHCIANMYFIPTGMLLKTFAGIAPPAGVDPGILTVGSFFGKNLLPVTVGNIIGGVIFVGMSYWSAYVGPQKEI